MTGIDILIKNWELQEDYRASKNKKPSRIAVKYNSDNNSFYINK